MVGKRAKDELAQYGLTEADSNFLFNLPDKGYGSDRPAPSASGESRLEALGFIEQTGGGKRRTTAAGYQFIDVVGGLDRLSNFEAQDRESPASAKPERSQEAKEQIARSREALRKAQDRAR